jgi:DNA-binding transcriptional MocR family regulator
LPAEPPEFITSTVDFTRSIPPAVAILDSRLAETLRAIADAPSPAALLHDSAAGGAARDREAGAAWLAPRFREQVDPARLLVTNGTQGAILLLLEHLVGAGGLLLAQDLSYTPLDTLARRAHLRLRGVAGDHEGVRPDAFEAACRAERPRALYCDPTLHNPTTATMSEPRRLALAAIARRYGVAIIEDDPLGLLDPEAPRPIAALAPDICWYLMGTTKCLAHGLRVAYLVGPSPAATAAFLSPIARLSHWFPAPLALAVATRWIATRAAQDVLAAIRDEVAARRTLARDLLRGLDAVCPRGALHLWLGLPAQLARDDFVATLAAHRVLVRPASVFAVEDKPAPNAIRLSLSSPPHRDDVAHGLAAVAALHGSGALP